MAMFTKEGPLQVTYGIGVKLGKSVKGRRMRKSIDLPRAAVIGVLLFFISCHLIIKNGNDLYHYNHPYDLSELQPSMLDEGKYVNCSVDTYLMKYFVAEGIGSGYSGSMGGFITFGKTYEVYTIPFSEGDYIRIAIGEPKKVKQLNAFHMGKGEPVTFMARIREDALWSDTDWYDGIENLDKNRVVRDYILWEETDFSIKNGLYFGIYLLLFSVFLYWRSGGIHITEEEDELNLEKLYANTFNKHNELEVLENRLPRYEKQAQSLKLWAKIGLCCFLLGVFFIFKMFQMYNTEPLLPGIFFTIYGAKEMWSYFINSGSKTAVKTADFLRIDTLYRKQELTKKKVEYLRKQVGQSTKENMSNLMSDLQRAEERAEKEGWMDEDDLEKELIV